MFKKKWIPLYKNASFVQEAAPYQADVCKHRELRRSQQAFTLIELLVVIAIIALLVSLSFSLVSSSQKRAFEASTTSRLRQLHLAFQTYALENRFYYPSFYNPSDSHPQIWQERIAPYVGISNWNAADQIKQRMIFNSPYQQQASGDSAYWQVGRSFGVNSFLAHPQWGFRSDLNRRPSQIVLIGDMEQANSDFVNTADGANWYGSGFPWARPAYRHSRDRALFVFCDGHVAGLQEEQLVLNPESSPNVWKWWD